MEGTAAPERIVQCDSLVDEIKLLVSVLDEIDEKTLQNMRNLSTLRATARGQEFRQDNKNPSVKVDDAVVIFDDNEQLWKEGIVDSIDRTGYPVVKIGSEGTWPVSYIKGQVNSIALVNKQNSYDVNRQNEMDFEARGVIQNIRTEINKSIHPIKGLKQREIDLVERKHVLRQSIQSQYKEKKHGLNLKMQALQSQHSTTTRQLQEFLSEEVQLKAKLVQIKEKVNTYEAEIESLKCKSNRMKHRGKYKNMLLHILESASSPKEVEETLGKCSVGTQVDPDLTELSSDKAYNYNKEKVIQREIRNFTDSTQELVEFNCDLETEFTCLQCREHSTQICMMWPCGHNFCFNCASSMAVAHNVSSWRCSACDGLSSYDFIPNHTLSSLSIKWKVKDAGHHDLQQAFLAFEEKLAAINRKYNVHIEW